MDSLKPFAVLLSFLALIMASVAQSSVSNSTNSIPAGVPEFVVKYAPLVYLHSKERYMPSDISAQLANTVPKINSSDLPANASVSPLTLDNLDQLNKFGNGGTNIYLTSKDDVTKSPKWMEGIRPGPDGKITNGKTCAIIVADKGNGTVDAFYISFYAFNWGGVVLGNNLGNHVGDWEHTMVRFLNGVPQAVWFSQHSSGQAFTYKAVEKDKAGLRPIAYAANGSHACYAIKGTHDHTIPSLHHETAGLLNDYTDAGFLYDPIYSAYWYKWTPPPANAPTNKTAPAPNATDPVPLRNVNKRGTFTPYDPAHPVAWLYFEGRWGDQRYPEKDKRQADILDQFWRYDNGPTGPADKNLGRKNVWNGSNHVIYTKLGP